MTIEFFFLHTVSGTFVPEKNQSKITVETLVCRIIGTIYHIFDFMVPLGRENDECEDKNMDNYDI